jgi:heterodisulfide reductase subunit C
VATATRIDRGFAEAVASSPRFDARQCMNCGVCSAVCPMEFPLLPRRIFRYAVLGLKDDVLAHSDVIFQCLLCGMCELNCTADVHIVDNVRFLRRYIVGEVFGIDRTPVPRPGTAAGEERHAATHA